MNPVLFALKRVYDFRVRGFRCVDIVGGVILVALVFSVYIVKTAAARESSEISAIEAEIRENAERVRLLRAEATRLEQPARLEALSRQVGLGPVEVKKQATADALPEIAAAHKPAEPAPVAAAPAAATPAATNQTTQPSSNTAGEQQ